MIPFEREVSLTETEEVVESILESNWDYVVRTSPGVLTDFEQRFPKICELVSIKASEDGVEDLSSVFIPGVPDFMGFDDNGEYVFVEVKGEGDGLRHTQLKWFMKFQGLNSEIWFTDSNDSVTEKMDSDNLKSYTFDRASKDKGEAEVRSGEDSFVNIQLPETLAAVMSLEEGDKVSWSIKDRSRLILDTD